MKIFDLFRRKRAYVVFYTGPIKGNQGFGMLYVTCKRLLGFDDLLFIAGELKRGTEFSDVVITGSQRVRRRK